MGKQVEEERLIFRWFKRVGRKKISMQYHIDRKEFSTTTVESSLEVIPIKNPVINIDQQSHTNDKGNKNRFEVSRSDHKTDLEIGVNDSSDPPVLYSPETVIDSIEGVGNRDILKELQPIVPVYWNIPMPDLLEVFKQYPQYTFFPVVDDLMHPQGIIREQKLKKFVYSRFGAALLENPDLKDKLTDFIEPCTIVGVDDKSEEILKTYSESGTTEGIIVTADSKYLGVISLRSLVKMGHDRELNLQESHNRILEQRNKDINHILRNMKQGIFTIQEDGTVHHDYSVHLETLLETNEIEGRHYVDLLFQNANLEKDKLSQTRSVIENSMGEDVLTFEVNSHLLIEEYRICFSGERTKHIELFWNPVVDEDDIIRRFIVNIRDKTEIVTLQNNAFQQQKEFKIITQVLSITRDRFEEFIKSSNEYVESCIALLDENSFFEMSVIDHIFRNLHTIKGNSRLYGFDDLTNSVHDVEESVNQVRSRNAAYDSRELKSEILKVDSMLKEYIMVTEKKLSSFQGTKQKGVFLDNQLYSALTNTLMSEKLHNLPDSIQTIIKSKKILNALNTASLEDLFSDVGASLKSMAEIVGKPKPNLFITSNNIRIIEKISSILNVIIMHSIRNSLVHGIEDPQMRRALGKPAEGNIHLFATLTDDQFRVEYWDDGTGLDLKKIMSKALDSGLVKLNKPLHDRQIAQFIFCPGLSTTNDITEMAGRGVGMDAILKAIKSVEGSMDIIFLDKKDDSSSKRPFKFVLNFPGEYAQLLS